MILLPELVPPAQARLADSVTIAVAAIRILARVIVALHGIGGGSVNGLWRVAGLIRLAAIAQRVGGSVERRRANGARRNAIDARDHFQHRALDHGAHRQLNGL